MKIYFISLSCLISLNVSAGGPQLPSWLTDDKAKLEAVNQLVKFMQDDKFYKIKSFELKREFDEVQKFETLVVVLYFDDPSCQGRFVDMHFLAPLCGEKGCQTFVGLTDCSGVKIQNLMKTRKLVRKPLLSGQTRTN